MKNAKYLSNYSLNSYIKQLIPMLENPDLPNEQSDVIIQIF